MSNIKIAAYAASFDPVTLGHLNVIKRMAPLYDELVVFIAVNERKKYMFSEEERMDMVTQCTKDIKNVKVVISKDRYLVNHARELGVDVIIRGLRNANDLIEEMTLFEANRAICPEIQTVWVPSWHDLTHVSSSAVKSHIGMDPGWKDQVKKLVTQYVFFKINRKHTIERARMHWAELVYDMGNPSGFAEQIEDILSKYLNKKRFYHVLEHIVNMLDELKASKFELSKIDSYALRLAIWYHDIVYNLENKDGSKNENNELHSTMYFMDKILRTEILSKELCGMVSDLISYTDHKHKNLIKLGQILVDLDLVIFGQPEDVFNEYDQNIRREYHYVPEITYLEARKNILQRFANKDCIYHTHYFRALYEDKAKENLGRVICDINNRLFILKK